MMERKYRFQIYYALLKKYIIVIKKEIHHLPNDKWWIFCYIENLIIGVHTNIACGREGEIVRALYHTNVLHSF